MAERPIWYEPHPVTTERKADLRAQGFKIMDARFAPEGWTPPRPAAPEQGGLTKTEIARMPRAGLVQLLEAHGMTAEKIADMSVSDLRDMARDVVFVDI